MLIKLHGTSGSGKSTVARFLMGLGTVAAHNSAYECIIPNFKQPLYILGLYNSACGGCDTLTAGQQISLIEYYAPKGHVFYEGLLGSEYYGKLGAVSEQYGDQHVFAFLDTPIEVCIERVKARRIAKGNHAPLNEFNTRERVKRINSLKNRLLKTNRNVITVEYLNASSKILEILKEYDAKLQIAGRDAVLDGGAPEDSR
jgi:predicted ABC-type ATPase